MATHAIVKQALPLSILCFLLTAFAGFLPPWSVCVVLFVGGSAAWASHRANRERTALSICGVAGVTCLLLLWPRVEIRAATPSDKVYERYFGSPRENFTARNIAIANGTFTLGTWLTGQLFYVNDGKVQELNAFSVGRTPNAIGAQHWVDMGITLALVTSDSENGQITQLASAGQSRGGGHSTEIPTSVIGEYSQIAAGRLLFGQSRILYIEGDTQFTLTSDMTVESFAKTNEGSFYVVVIGLQ